MEIHTQTIPLERIDGGHVSRLSQHLQAMESSRIFVRGLPPNLSPKDFKNHFSEQSAVTDAKLLPHRRIGYVGYKTPEDAAKAVKYHNRSFIRMSKIGVELARSVEDQHTRGLGISSANNSKRKRADVREHGSTDADIDEKRKRKYESPAAVEGKPKLKEFLEVMRPPSKLNIWENQDAKISEESARPTPQAENTSAGVNLSKEVDERIFKEGQKEGQSEAKDVVSAELPAPVATLSVDVKTLPSDVDVSRDDIQEPLVQSLAVSDEDWLRSRTSRLLGLMDDNDVQAAALPKNASTEKVASSEVPELVKDNSVSDASVQRHEESAVEEAIPEREIAVNGRLFVRNLTYTITEEDLRKHFEDRGHGTIEEVSPDPYDWHLYFYLVEFL